MIQNTNIFQTTFFKQAHPIPISKKNSHILILKALSLFNSSKAINKLNKPKHLFKSFKQKLIWSISQSLL